MSAPSRKTGDSEADYAELPVNDLEFGAVDGPRSLRLGCSAPVVEADGPEGGGDGDADAPGDGGDGVGGKRAAPEQAPHGVGDGGEGLGLSALAQGRLQR